MKTPAQMKQIYANAERIAAGIYQQKDGTALINVNELLDHFGWERTPENHAEVVTATLAFMHGLDVPVVELRRESDGNGHEILHLPPLRTHVVDVPETRRKDGAA